MTTTAVESLTTRTLLNRVGGVRGTTDDGLPPLVFVVLNTAAWASMAPGDTVRTTLAGALATGAVIIVAADRPRGDDARQEVRWDA